MNQPPPTHADCETTFEDPCDPGKRHPFGTLQSEATIDLSIVVPAYNEEFRLPSMLDETLAYLEARRNRDNLKYEIIIVDDGSKDNTIDIVSQYISKYTTEHIRLLRMCENSGKGAAVRRGMLSTRGDRILMADADAATVFEDLESLERCLQSNVAQVAIGSRAHLRKNHSIATTSQQDNPSTNSSSSSSSSNSSSGRDSLRAFVSVVFNLVVVLIGGVVGLEDTQCGFKLYSRSAARVAFEGQQLTRWAFDVENLYRVQHAGMSVVEVPVRWTEVAGSKLSVVKATINMTWDMIRMRYHYESGGWSLPSPASSSN